MCKKLISFVFCILVSCMVLGQGPGTLYDFPINGKTNIVRYDPSTGFHIACINTSSYGIHFALTDFNNIIDVEIASDLRVKDFEIIDNYVFFCGDASGPSGFIGWFDIDSLFHLGGATHIDKTLSALGLKLLDNIEVYHNPLGEICIAGYGLYDMPLSGWPYFRAFEAVGLPSSGMSYRTLDLIYAGDIVDMAVTDNYVVYMNHDRNSACYNNNGIGVILQPFPKYGIFSSPPFQFTYLESITSTIRYPDGVHAYVTPDNDDPYYAAPPKMVHSTNDNIAVCSYRRDFDFNGWSAVYPVICGSGEQRSNTYLALRTYDLSPLSTGNPILMTSASAAPLFPDEGISIDGFEYDNIMGRYIVLHRHVTATGIDEHAITTLDYSMGVPPGIQYSYYQTTYDTKTYWMPTSMCMAAGSDYTVSGYDQNTSDYIFWHRTNHDMMANCERQTIQQRINLPTSLAKENPNPYLPTVWKPLMFQLTIPGDLVESDSDAICR